MPRNQNMLIVDMNMFLHMHVSSYQPCSLCSNTFDCDGPFPLEGFLFYIHHSRLPLFYNVSAYVLFSRGLQENRAVTIAKMLLQRFDDRYLKLLLFKDNAGGLYEIDLDTDRKRVFVDDWIKDQKKVAALYCRKNNYDPDGDIFQMQIPVFNFTTSFTTFMFQDVEYFFEDKSEYGSSVSDNAIILDLDCTVQHAFVCDDDRCTHTPFVHMDMNYHSHWRPHLQEFLDFLDEAKIDIIIFSAAPREYVNNVTKEIFRQRARKPVAILASIQSGSSKTISVVDRLVRTYRRILAIDDDTSNYREFSDKPRTIFIKPWTKNQYICYYTSEQMTNDNDDELLKLIPQLKLYYGIKEQQTEIKIV